MKWIRNRKKFLNEAKLRDVLLPTQAKEITKKWGEKYLDYEEIEPTNNIEQGKWKLTEADKINVLSTFMMCDMQEVSDLFQNLPKAFNDFVTTVAENSSVKNININKPTLDQLTFILSPVFKKISVNDSLASSVISKDENNRPIKDSDNNMIKVEKIPGELVLSNNLVNLNTTLEDYNSLVSKYIEKKLGDKYKSSDLLDDNIFNNKEFLSYVNISKDNENRDYKYDVEIFEKDIYLSIKHNPKDILNMSISKFYSSCQHLYTGVCRSQLLANVFDPNSIPAFLLFDTPIFDKDGQKLSDVVPLSRMQIREIETLDNKDVKLYFDRAYPDRMEDILVDIIEKYTKNKAISDSDNDFRYVYAPDIEDNSLEIPYHDRLGNKITRKKKIGLNTKTLELKDLVDWNNYIIMPNNNIKELVIETDELPENLLDININLEWIKFKYLKLDSLNLFNKISFSAIAFDKCKFNNNIFDEIAVTTPEIKKIKLISCDNSGIPDFSQFKNLEELHFIYTLDNIEQLKQVVDKVNLKKLVISGDLFTNENKPYFNLLKSKKVKIEVVGPSI